MSSAESNNLGRRLRQWMRGLEPRVLDSLNGPMFQRAKPWLDRHDVFNFNREPLARGVALVRSAV